MANNALNQKLKPSAELSEILGSSQPVTRAEAVKRLWDYVKEDDLQNPENRREILADDKLRLRRMIRFANHSAALGMTTQWAWTPHLHPRNKMPAGRRRCGRGQECAR